MFWVILIVLPIAACLLAGFIAMLLTETGRKLLLGLLIAAGVFVLVAIPFLFVARFSYQSPEPQRATVVSPGTQRDSDYSEADGNPETMPSESTQTRVIVHRPAVGIAFFPLLIFIGAPIFVILIVVIVLSASKGHSNKERPGPAYGAPMPHQKQSTGTGGMVAGIFGAVIVCALVAYMFLGHFGRVNILVLMPFAFVMCFVIAFTMAKAFGKKHQPAHVNAHYAHKGSGGGKILAGVVIGVLVLVLVSLAVPLIARRQQMAREVQLQRIQAMELAQVQTVQEAQIWKEGVDRQMIADVYPSRRQAVLSLGKRAAETVITGFLADEQVSRTVMLFQDENDPGLISELANEIKNSIPVKDATCKVMNSSDKVDLLKDNMEYQNMIFAQLSYSNQKMKGRFSIGRGDAISGKAMLTVKGPTEQGVMQNNMIHANFAEKPWLTMNFNEFQAQNPEKRYLLARSFSSTTNQAQAQMEAKSQACRKIADILNQMRRKRPGGVTSFSVNLSDLDKHAMIADQFEQEFFGSAGSIWRNAMLVDISENKINSLAQEKLAFMQAQFKSWAQIGVSLVGVLVLICVVYAFLNAATRGYYTWMLRIVTIVLIGVCIFAAISLVS